MASTKRLPGQYYDAETNLHYNLNRYYDPQLARYITSDPIGLDGGFNTYVYSGQNAVRFFDPLGLVHDVFTGDLDLTRKIWIYCPDAPPGAYYKGYDSSEVSIFQIKSTGDCSSIKCKYTFNECPYRDEPIPLGEIELGAECNIWNKPIPRRKPPQPSTPGIRG